MEPSLILPETSTKGNRAALSDQVSLFIEEGGIISHVASIADL